MALWRSMGARKDATRGTTALEVRKMLERIWVRPGMTPRSSTTLITGTAGWTYLVDIAGFVTQNGVGDGFHVFGNDGAIEVATDAAPGAGLSRIDIIWVRHQSTETGDTVADPIFGVAKSVAASSPTAPSIPTGALELGRNTMTSAATTTASSGNSISITAPWTGLMGTAIVVRNDAEEAVAPGASQQRPVLVWNVASRRYKVSAGGAFMPLSVGVLTGREPITNTGSLASLQTLTDTITVPALPVAYRVTVVATGRTGGDGTRRLAYYFDALGALSGFSTQDPADADTHVLASAGARTTVTSTLVVDVPAGTDCQFRLRLSSPDGNASSSGALVWTRTPAP
jgi:hypothetical protein